MAEEARELRPVGFEQPGTRTTSISGMLMRNVDEIAKSWKLQRSYNWEFLLPDVGGINGLEVAKYCKKLSFGEYSIAEVSTIRYGAFKKGYAGLLDVATVNAVFHRPVPDLVSTYFMGWKRLMVNDQGFYYPKNSYARTAYVKFYDRDGSETGNYRLSGLFPTKFPAYDLAYDSEEIVPIEIDFNVDKVTIEG